MPVLSFFLDILDVLDVLLCLLYLLLLIYLLALGRAYIFRFFLVLQLHIFLYNDDIKEKKGGLF